MSPFLGGAGNKIVIGTAMTLAEPESSQGAPPGLSAPLHHHPENP